MKINLIVVTGLPGSGKTKVAKEIAKGYGAELLSSDVLRREVAAVPVYTEQKKLGVYDRMFERAEKALGQKQNVVMDATFYRAELRKNTKKIAWKFKAKFLLIECVADEAVIKERLEQRFMDNKHQSDADWGVYEKIKGQFERINEKHKILDTSAGSIEAARNFLRSLGKISQDALAEQLQMPEAYQHETEQIEMKKTHISYVFLTGPFAYKVKKAVNFGFVNYGTLEKRKFFCEKEVAFNSKFSKGSAEGTFSQGFLRKQKGLYKGVVPIKMDRRGAIKVGAGKGQIVEYAVKMLQMPQEALMSSLLRQGAINETTVEKVAEIVANYHKKAKCNKKILAYGQPESVWQNISHGFAVESVAGQLGLADEVVEIKNRMRSFLERNRGLFLQRMREKKIRQCHGDLHSNNVFIQGGKIYVFDAIEFNDQIACCDIAADIAFFLMDLEFNGREDLARVFLQKWQAVTKDKGAERLLPFYKAYRAMVRAMVNSFRLKTPDLSMAEKNEAEGLCRKYVVLAKNYAGGF